MHAVLEVHRVWAWVAIAANGLVGAAALVAWRVPRLRGRLELFYGIIGLFLMGVGIRAVLQVR